MTDARRERIARNESSFRELNEALHGKVHGSLTGAGERSGFVCECGLSECLEVVTVPLAEYERVRQDSRDFLVAPGHELPDAESVIASGEGYNVVRKNPEFEELVKETDPRS